MKYCDKFQAVKIKLSTRDKGMTVFLRVSCSFMVDLDYYVTSKHNFNSKCQGVTI